MSYNINDYLTNLVEIQENLLSGRYLWNLHRNQNQISIHSQNSGPEMIHVGTRYGNPEIPLRIVFLGLCTNYKEGELMDGTPRWILENGYNQELNIPMTQRDATPFVQDLSLDTYQVLRSYYEQNDVSEITFFTGRGTGSNSNYTIPLVIEETYNALSHPFVTENPIKYSAETISMLNLFPFEGSGPSGMISGSPNSWVPYGHVISALDILQPNLVFVFGAKAWKHLEFHAQDYDLTLIPEYYLAYRRDQNELWMNLYHFSHTAQFSPMNDFRENGVNQLQTFFRSN